MITRLALLTLLLIQGTASPVAQFGTIAGRVLHQNGSPARGVRISALEVPEGPAGANSALISSGETDADGRYRLTDVPAGRYYITAGPFDELTYFPGASVPDKARVVTMEPRAELKDINFPLVTPPRVLVSGVLVREDGSIAVPGPDIGSLATGGRGRGANSFPTQIQLNNAGQRAATAISPSGTFEFKNVRPGTYQIVVTPAARIPPQTVEIGETDITNLRVVVPRLILIGGAIAVEGGPATPMVRLLLEPQGTTQRATVDARGNIQQGGGMNVNAMGSFTVLMPAGEYRVTASIAGMLFSNGTFAESSPLGFAVKSMTADSVNLLTDNLKVTAAASVPFIRVTLSAPVDAPARITGRIVGRGVGGATPNIVLTGGMQGGTRAATVYLDGSFEVRDVMPDSYHIQAVVPTAPSNTSFLEQEGINVTVGATGATDLLLPVPPSTGVLSRDRSTAAPGDTRVSGRIVGRAQRTGPATVTLSGGGLPEELSTPLYWNGTFEFPSVPHGTYAAAVRPLIPGGKPETITVMSSAPISNIEIHVPPTRAVRGRVSLDGSGPLPSKANFLIAGADGSAAVSRVTSLQPDGSFALILPEGATVRYATNSLPAGYTVKSLTYGETDAQTKPISFGTPESAVLQVALNTNRAATFKVGGRVTGAKLPSGSKVLLVGASRSGAILSTSIQDGGTFDFSSVPPGEYTLLISDIGMMTSPLGRTIQLTDRDIAGLELAAPRFATGKIVVAGGATQQAFSLPLKSDREETIVTIVPQWDGSFRVALPVGVWQIGQPVGLPQDVRIASMTYGRSDVTRGPLRVTNTDTGTMTISLSR